MKQHSGLQIQDEDFVHGFRREKQAAALEVHAEVVEAALHFCRQLDSVNEAERFR